VDSWAFDSFFSFNGSYGFNHPARFLTFFCAYVIFSCLCDIVKDPDAQMQSGTKQQEREMKIQQLLAVVILSQMAFSTPVFGEVPPSPMKQAREILRTYTQDQPSLWDFMADFSQTYEPPSAQSDAQYMYWFLGQELLYSWVTLVQSQGNDGALLKTVGKMACASPQFLAWAFNHQVNEFILNLLQVEEATEKQREALAWWLLNIVVPYFERDIPVPESTLTLSRVESMAYATWERTNSSQDFEHLIKAREDLEKAGVAGVDRLLLQFRLRREAEGGKALVRAYRMAFINLARAVSSS
jgi:hypothetical protein